MTTGHPHNKAKDFFLHLGSAIALYASAISLLHMLFDVINVHFPDVLDYGFDPYSSSLRTAIATLIILFPLYLVIMRYLNADLARHPEKRDLGIRKWLTYLTLFLAGVAIVTDLVVLINTFLGGEITGRFVWKVLAVLIVAAGVFGYYFYDLRNVWQEDRKKAKIVSVVASLFVVCSIVLAFMVVGSPKTQRLLRIDSQKITDLQSIQNQIIYQYWEQKGKLPSSLDVLNDPISGFVVPQDPETNLGKAYTYNATDTFLFELCADFNLSTPTTGTPIGGPERLPVGASMDTTYRGVSDNWQHGADHVCFERTIDPELYPVMEKTKL